MKIVWLVAACSRPDLRTASGQGTRGDELYGGKLRYAVLSSRAGTIHRGMYCAQQDKTLD